jgi:hypothetical protein
VVHGDFANRASLRAALKSCYGAFGVMRQHEHGRNLINAVAGSEVEHFVFCCRSPCNAELEDYARSLGLPATFVRAPFGAPLAGVAEIFESPAAFLGRVVDIKVKEEAPRGASS